MEEGRRGNRGVNRRKVLVLVNPRPRELRKLVTRHRVVAVAVVVEVRDSKTLGALSRHYGARPLKLPPELLLEGASV